MYLDTGILVKLLVPEADSAFFDQGLRGHSLVTSELAKVEVQSALFAKERTSVLTPAQRARAEEKFAAMIDDGILEIRPLNQHVLRKATQTIQACHPAVPLRALDALHVATCDLEQEFPLCTTDARMHAAAKVMHIPVYPGTLPLKV